MRNCRRALATADLVFAVINTEDAFGTIAEVGMAAGLGKAIAIAMPPSLGWDGGPLWFVDALATVSVRWRGGDPYDPEGFGCATDALMEERDAIPLMLQEAIDGVRTGVRW